MGEIAGHLGDPLRQLAASRRGALFLAVERLARDDEPLQIAAARELSVAKRRQGVGGDPLGSRSLRLKLGALLDLAREAFELRLGLSQRLRGLPMIDQSAQRLGASDGAGEVAIARRLPRLPLEALGLRVELLQNVVEARQIVGGGLEAQFGLVAARMQPGDAGGLLEDAAALLRLRGDQFADLTLPHHRRRARARRRRRRTEAARPWRAPRVR